MTGILLTVAAIALPQQSQTSHEARKMGEVIRRARVRAMRDGRTHTLSVADGKSSWEFAVRPNGAVATSAEPPNDSTTVTVLWEADATDAP